MYDIKPVECERNRFHGRPNKEIFTNPQVHVHHWPGGCPEHLFASQESVPAITQAKDLAIYRAPNMLLLWLAITCMQQPIYIIFGRHVDDIELNPGPTNFTVCTLNIRSILHPLHSAALSDLIDAHNPDLFCLTETWIRPTTTSAELYNCTPPNYTFLSVPRKHSGNNSCTGGGTGFLIREPFTQLPTSLPDFSSFESSSITLQLSRSKLSVFNIYRPPSSSTLSKPFSVFLDDFNSFLSSSSSPATLIFTSIIPLITSLPSFCLFSPLSTSVNTLLFLPITKTIFSI